MYTICNALSYIIIYNIRIALMSCIILYYYLYTQRKGIFLFNNYLKWVDSMASMDVEIYRKNTNSQIIYIIHILCYYLHYESIFYCDCIHYIQEYRAYIIWYGIELK